jgi:hypothetical protein
LPFLKVTETKPLPLTGGIAWGQSIVDDGGYTYVYGSEQTDDFQFAHVARVPAGGLGGPWTFWDGATWSPEEARSARLASGVGTSFSVDRVGDAWVLLSMESHLPLNSSVVAYTAKALTGPFTDPVELYRVPEANDQQRPVIVYDATLHPELAHPGKLLFSYNVNSLEQKDIYADATLYRPRFVEVPWPPATRDQARLPEPPTTLAARSDEDGRVQLSWAAAGGDTTYRVYQKDVTAGQIQWVRLPRPVDGASTLLDQLKNGHRYEYRVTAEGPAGEGRRSDPVAATATVAPPDPPGDLAAAEEGGGEITLTWTGPRRAWRFAIEKRDVTAGESGFTKMDHPRGSATTHVVGGLTNGHEYEFRVRAIGGGGPGAWARVRATSWKGYPTPPANVAATAQPGGTVRLSWTAPVGRVTYRVYQRDVTAGQANAGQVPASVNGTAATVGGLVPGHEYEFAVTATNRVGESGRSFPARVTAV